MHLEQRFAAHAAKIIGIISSLSLLYFLHKGVYTLISKSGRLGFSIFLILIVSGLHDVGVLGALALCSRGPGGCPTDGLLDVESSQVPVLDDAANLRLVFCVCRISAGLDDVDRLLVIGLGLDPRIPPYGSICCSQQIQRVIPEAVTDARVAPEVRRDVINVRPAQRSSWCTFFPHPRRIPICYRTKNISSRTDCLR